MFNSQKIYENLWRHCIEALPWYWIGVLAHPKWKIIRRHGFWGLYEKILGRVWKVAGLGAARLDFFVVFCAWSSCILYFWAPNHFLRTLTDLFNASLRLRRQVEFSCRRWGVWRTLWPVGFECSHLDSPHYNCLISSQHYHRAPTPYVFPPSIK